MAILRIQSLWTGFPGAPGYTNWHFMTETPTGAVANSAAAAVRSFFGSISALLPTGLSVQAQSSANVYEITGTKTGEVPVSTPGTPIVGGATAAYASGTGAVVHWRTGFFSQGRQLVGRTFIVPLANGFDTNGTLSGAALTSLQTAADTYRATAGLDPCVWSPRGTTGPSTASKITSAIVPDRPAVMRSRR